LGRWDLVFGAIVLSQLVFLIWLSLRYDLGWDGLFALASRARFAFLNRGSIPFYAYTSDRAFGHNHEALFFPQVEVRIGHYQWVPRPAAHRRSKAQDVATGTKIGDVIVADETPPSLVGNTSNGSRMPAHGFSRIAPPLQVQPDLKRHLVAPGAENAAGVHCSAQLGFRLKTK